MPRASAARSSRSAAIDPAPAAGAAARSGLGRGFAPAERAAPPAAGSGHDFATVRVARTPPPARSGPPVIQRWAWLKRKLGIGHDWDPERRPLREGEINVRRHRADDIWGPQQVSRSAHRAIETPVPSDVETGLSLVSKGGSGTQGIARGAEYLRSTGSEAPAWASGVGVGANALSAVGSTVEAGLKTHQILTGSQKKKDKALTGLGAISDLGNATISGANAARSIPGVGSGVGTVASTIAGPAALVTGAADVLGGSISAGLASHRQGKLAALQDRHWEIGHGELATGGAARFAKEAQKTRKYRGIGTALKGGLAIAGGAALLAGAGPVGWGLLAGAAVVGGAASLYKKWRKHRIGTKVLNSPDWRARLEEAGVKIPTSEDLAGQSRLKRWNPLNTKESRAYDLMRGQLGVSLTRQGDHDFRDENKRAILDRLGIKKKKGRAQDVAAALEG